MTKNRNIFIDEYLIDLNATRAYKVAYPKVKNDNTAAVNGSKLLRNTKVKKEIEKRMKEREKRTEITQDKVLKEIANLAFIDRTDIVKIISGKLVIKDFSELTPEQRACISSIKVTKFGIDVTFYNKEKALELLGKHLGMFTEKLEVKGEVKTNNPFSGLTTEELKKIINTEK